MAIKVKNLPQEILDRVFSYLVSADCSVCQRVCKAWYQPAQSELYRNTVVSSPHGTSKFLQCLRVGDTANLVRNLWIKGHSRSAPLTRQPFSLMQNDLFSLCIKLERITLEKMNPFFMLYPLFDGTCPSLKRLTNITLIDSQMSPGVKAFHLKANWVHSSTIKILTIYNIQSRAIAELGGIHDYLQAFQNLQQLEIFGDILSNTLFLFNALSELNCQKLTLNVGDILWDVVDVEYGIQQFSKVQSLKNLSVYGKSSVDLTVLMLIMNTCCNLDVIRFRTAVVRDTHGRFTSARKASLKEKFFEFTDRVRESFVDIERRDLSDHFWVTGLSRLSL